MNVRQGLVAKAPKPIDSKNASETWPVWATRILRGVSLFSFCTLWLPCFVRLSQDTTSYLNTAWFESFAAWALGGCMLGGALFLTLATFGHKARKELRWFAVIGSACFLIGCGFLTAQLAGLMADVSVPIVAAAGIAFGVGFSLLCIVWCTDVRGITLRRALVAAVCIGAGAVALHHTLSLMPQPLVTLAIGLLSVLGIVGPCIKAHSAEQEVDSNDKACSRSNIAAERASTVEEPLGGTFSTMATMTFGLMMFGMCSNSQQIGFGSNYMSNAGIALFLGSVVGLAIVVLVRDRQMLPFLYWVAFPLVAAALIVLDTFPTETAPFVLGKTGGLVFFSSLGFLSIANLVAVSTQGEHSPLRTFGITLICAAGASLAGIIMYRAGMTLDQRGITLLVISTIYFVYLTLTPAVQLWKTRKTDTAFGALAGSACTQADAAQRDAQAFETLCGRNDLSPREREILSYLRKGYNSPFIARSLNISESTVRSHLQNIYHKLGVSSRMELIAHVEAETQGARHQ